jgi:hypothetical protein
MMDRRDFLKGCFGWAGATAALSAVTTAPQDPARVSNGAGEAQDWAPLPSTDLATQLWRDCHDPGPIESIIPYYDRLFVLTRRAIYRLAFLEYGDGAPVPTLSVLSTGTVDQSPRPPLRVEDLEQWLGWF